MYHILIQPKQRYLLHTLVPECFSTVSVKIKRFKSFISFVFRLRAFILSNNSDYLLQFCSTILVFFTLHSLCMVHKQSIILDINQLYILDQILNLSCITFTLIPLFLPSKHNLNENLCFKFLKGVL